MNSRWNRLIENQAVRLIEILRYSLIKYSRKSLFLLVAFELEYSFEQEAFPLAITLFKVCLRFGTIWPNCWQFIATAGRRPEQNEKSNQPLTLWLYWLPQNLFTTTLPDKSYRDCNNVGGSKSFQGQHDAHRWVNSEGRRSFRKNRAT